jgi:hypothetical protein
MHYPILLTLSYLVAIVAASQTYACGKAIKLRLRPDLPVEVRREIRNRDCLTINGGTADYLDYKDGDTKGKVSEVFQYFTLLCSSF